MDYCVLKNLYLPLLTPDHVKFISFKNQQHITQPTLMNLHLNEYIEGLHYYPFIRNLDRSMGSCNTLNDLSNKRCVAIKTGDLNLCVLI